MKVQPKTIREAFLPIMIISWLLGYSILEYPLGKPRPVLSLLYLFIISILYCYTKFYDPYYKELLDDTNETRKSIFKYLEHVNLFVSTCCVLIGSYNYKACKIALQRMELIDKALEHLVIPNEYHTIFINSLLKIGVWFILVCILALIDLYFFLQTVDFMKSLQLVYLCNYPIQQNCVVQLTFTSIVNYIGMRFENINVLLKNISSKDPIPKYVKELYPRGSRIEVLVMSTAPCDILNYREQQKMLITLIKHLHMELTKISAQINKIYQIQITMLVGAIFANITVFYYGLLTYIFLDKKNFHTNFITIFATVAWSAFYPYRFFNINSTCARVIAESRKTREILCQMKNTTENAELKEEIDQFSLQLAYHRLAFSVCGFTLDYTFIQKFIGIFTTYLVILVHMTLNKTTQ